MILIETSVFTRRIRSLASDDDYAAFQRFLIDHPEAGSVIRGSGGLRKTRMAGSQAGKRGGLRIIYRHIANEQRIWLLLVYDKRAQSDLTKAQLDQLMKLVDERR